MYKLPVFCLLTIVALLAISTSPARAQPVEYVKACTDYGPNYFYSTGTLTCVNAITGETRTETPDGTVFGQTQLAARLSGVESELLTLEQQVAIANALEDPDLVGGEHYGIKFNWGDSGSQNAFGFTGAVVLVNSSPQNGNGRLTLSGGLAFSGNQAGGRASMQFSW